MKIAIISDIHGNPTALQKVLEDAEEHKCERIVCLGDIVGYGYDPNGCIDICRKQNIECILGNHDAGLVGNLTIDWFNPFAADALIRQRNQVSEANKDWLRSLPYTINATKTLYTPSAYSHGTLWQPEKFYYVNSGSDAALEFVYMKSIVVSILFVGHTHFANIFHWDERNFRVIEGYVDFEDEDIQYLNDGRMAIVNVGSIGFPRNQPYSIYGIFDTDTLAFKHRLLPFDFDDYYKRMRTVRAEIPIWMQSQQKRAEEMQKGFI